MLRQRPGGVGARHGWRATLREVGKVRRLRPYDVHRTRRGRAAIVHQRRQRPVGWVARGLIGRSDAVGGVRGANEC